MKTPIEGSANELDSLGIPTQVADAFRSIINDLYYVVSVQVEEVYAQTPGPGAGKRVEF